MAEIYVLDANALIQAKRRFYPFDVCPGYWKAVLWHRLQNVVLSVDRVRDEIERGKDDLWDWVKASYGVELFVSTDEGAVIKRYGEMVAWVQAQPQFKPAAKEEFSHEEEADAWVAAYAKATEGGVVVTLEEFSADVQKRVPLPNVCRAFDVEWITPFEMLHRLKVELDWDEPA
ncbi:DUF4411 family protein [soil metagenome]